MANKTNTADISVRATFAIVQGVVLAMSIPLLYMILPDTVYGGLPLILFLFVPILSFLTSAFINWFLQYMYCGSVSAGQIMMAASMSPVFTVILGGLSYMLPFLRSPIAQLFTESSLQENPQETQITKDLWGYSFYLFWAGVYGQTLSSGMVAACP